jgi:hypothetical protein
MPLRPAPESPSAAIRREEIELRRTLNLLASETVELGVGFAAIDANLDASELRRIADALDRIDAATPQPPAAA